MPREIKIGQRTFTLLELSEMEAFIGQEKEQFMRDEFPKIRASMINSYKGREDELDEMLLGDGDSLVENLRSQLAEAEKVAAILWEKGINNVEILFDAKNLEMVALLKGSRSDVIIRVMQDEVKEGNPAWLDFNDGCGRLS